jgi:hypothetical protein
MAHVFGKRRREKSLFTLLSFYPPSQKASPGRAGMNDKFNTLLYRVGRIKSFHAGIYGADDYDIWGGNQLPVIALEDGRRRVRK